jgi:hypothetical protein
MFIVLFDTTHHSNPLIRVTQNALFLVQLVSQTLSQSTIEAFVRSRSP